MPAWPGATSSVVRLPGSQQPTHGFAASWLRLASPTSNPPQQPASESMPATSRLSPARQGQVCLTCLRHLWPQANDQSHVSETGLKLRQPPSLSDVPQPPGPKSSIRPSFGVSRYASLRLASGPVPQPACWRVYWGYFSGVLKQMEVCIPTMYLSWAEQPSKKCMSWQAASHVKWRCPNTQSWSWLFSDTNYCSPFYGGQAPLKMLIPRKRSFFFQGH